MLKNWGNSSCSNHVLTENSSESKAVLLSQALTIYIERFNVSKEIPMIPIFTILYQRFPY